MNWIVIEDKTAPTGPKVLVLTGVDCTDNSAMPIDLLVFLVTAFVAALVASVAGFAFGLVAAAIWLQILTPLQTTTLIVVYGLLVQGYAVWKLRHAIDVDRLLPLLIGGQIGIPFGVVFLDRVPASEIRAAIGVFLIVFSLYSLFRPKLAPVAGERRLADGGIGILSGIVGGATGLAGIVPTVWASLRGWTKDEQRAVFQPIAVAIFAGSLLWLGGTASFDRHTLVLLVIGLPAVLAGSWVGLRLYGHLSEAVFRQIVLILLLFAGASLIVQLRHCF